MRLQFGVEFVDASACPGPRGSHDDVTEQQQQKRRDTHDRFPGKRPCRWAWSLKITALRPRDDDDARLLPVIALAVCDVCCGVSGAAGRCSSLLRFQIIIFGGKLRKCGYNRAYNLVSSFRWRGIVCEMCARRATTPQTAICSIYNNSEAFWVFNKI